MKSYISLALSMILFGGCVASTGDKHLSVSNIPGFSKDSGSANQIQANLPTTVAVIPFFSEDERASQVVTKFFYNSFSALKYKDIELDTVQRVLKDKTLEQINSMDIKTLGKMLGVDGIVMGKVTDFDKLFAGLYSSVTVGADIKFYSVKTGETIWQFKEDAAKREGGVAVTPIGIAVQLAMAAYNLREVQMYRAAEDLFRDIFKTIPEPLYSGAHELPRMKFAINNIKSKKAFKAGDELVFAIDAQEDLDLFAVIPSEKNLVPLTQTQKGHYEGKYIVTNNIEQASGTVEYILRHKNGIEAKYYDMYGKLNIDNIPPKTPDLHFNIVNDTVHLKFENTNGDEIEKYILEKLEEDGYKLFKQTQNNTIEFYLQKGESVYLRAFAQDFAGNLSEANAQPILISNLQDSRILTATKLPIVIEDMNLKEVAVIVNDTQISGNLRIKPNGVLFIDSKATVNLLENGTIINEGGELLVYANNNGARIESKNSDVALKLQNGNTVLNNLIIDAPRAILLSNNAKLKGNKIVINAQYDGISATDSSYVQLVSSQITASKDMADIKFEGVAYGDFDSITFYQGNIFDITSSSNKKVSISNSGSIKTLGGVDVQK
ncbi:MAG: hypothetical protein IE909_08105 [Campylobacterales bacterium]|nr:hypothetical protein [Campylobacterales bacterium]